MNAHALALWAGIVASLAGIAGGYASIHKDLQTARDESIAAARAQQQRADDFQQWKRDVERHLQFIDSTLPRERREMAQQVFALRQQVQEVKLQQPVALYEHRDAPALALHSMHALQLPAVAADATKTEKPQ